MPIRLRLSRSLHPLPLSSPFAHIPTRPDIPAVRSTKPGLAKRNNPLYRIIVQHSEKRRDAQGLEVVGIYDPVPRPLSELERATYSSSSSSSSGNLARLLSQDRVMERHRTRSGQAVEREVSEKFLMWDPERIRYWLGVGAEPSESVVKLLIKGGLVDPDEPMQTIRGWRQHSARERAQQRAGAGEGNMTSASGDDKAAVV